MKKRVVVTGLGAAVIAALVLLVPIASAAPGPQPVAPDQAQALIGAASPVASSSVTRRVSPQEALASASAPGAVVSVAPGMSAAEAVGLATVGGPVTPGSTLVKPAAADYYGCESNVSGWHWGIWPYDQNITDTTYWCAIYGVSITYRTTNVTATGTFCGTSWASSALISGGVGYTWFTMRASAGWSCPTDIPWITLHPTHYLDTSHNAWGNSEQVRAG